MTAAITSFWMSGLWEDEGSGDLDVPGILIAPGAVLKLEAGDDYAAAEFRGLQFVNTDNKWSQHFEALDLTGATPKLFVYGLSNKEIFSVTGSVIDAVTPDQKLTFDVLQASTALLSKYRGRSDVSYSVKVTMANAHVLTATEGKVTVS